MDIVADSPLHGSSSRTHIQHDPLLSTTITNGHTPPDPLLGPHSASPPSRPPTPPTKPAPQHQPQPSRKLIPEHAQARTQPGDHPAAYQPQPIPASKEHPTLQQQQQQQQPRELFVRIRITSIELLPRAVSFHLDATTNLPHFRASSYPRITRSYREFVLYALALTLAIPSIIIPAVPIPLPSLSHSSASSSSSSGERPTPEERHLKINLARWLNRLLEQPLVRDHLETRAFIESDYSYQPSPPKASTANSTNASLASNSAARKRWNSAMHAAASITGLPDRDFPEGIVHAIASGEGNGAAAFLLTSTATASAPQIDLGAGLGLPYGVFSTPVNGPAGYAGNSGGGGGGGTFSASRLGSFLKFGQSSSSSSSSASPTSAARLSTSRNLHDDDEDLVQARAEVTRLEMHFANAAIKADKVFGSTAGSVGNLPSTGAEGVVASATGGKDASAAAGARTGVLQATYDLANKLHSLALDEESRPTSVRGGLTRSLKSTSEMLRQSLKVEDAISSASTHSLLSALCYQSLNARSAKCALLQRNALVEEYNNAQKLVTIKRREVDALRAGRGSTSRMRADMLLEELDEAVRLERFLSQALKQLSATLTGSLLQHSRHAHTDLQGALLDHARSQLGLNRSLVGGLKALRREFDTIPSYEQVIADEKKMAEERKKAFLAEEKAKGVDGAKGTGLDQQEAGDPSAGTGSLPSTSIRPPNVTSPSGSTFLPGTARGSAAALAAAGLGAQGSWHQRYAVMHTSRTLEEETSVEAERKRLILAAAQKAEERERREEEERRRRREGTGGALPPRGWEDEDGVRSQQALPRHAGSNGFAPSGQPASAPVSQPLTSSEQQGIIGARTDDGDEDDDAPLGSKIRSGAAVPPSASENPFLNSTSSNNSGNGAVLPPSKALHQQRNLLYPESNEESWLAPASPIRPGGGDDRNRPIMPGPLGSSASASTAWGGLPSPGPAETGFAVGFGGGSETLLSAAPEEQDDWAGVSSSGFLGGGASGLNSSRFMGSRVGGGGGANGGGFGSGSGEVEGGQRQQGSNQGVGPSLNQGGGGSGPGGGAGGSGGGSLFGRSRLSASDAARSLGGTF
ncbi:hypothetical protein A4X09_0g4847 [Tilletia walkeri]|uniref:PX domain-containing protein n=1 Tax=Tilletia walkeri TaxID=117179 RepID=A0A8X7N8C7_9BASI|nr:hypothetical protein A4X09_0g4847 [Tilletia walkeri]